MNESGLKTFLKGRSIVWIECPYCGHEVRTIVDANVAQFQDPSRRWNPPRPRTRVRRGSEAGK